MFIVNLTYIKPLDFVDILLVKHMDFLNLNCTPKVRQKKSNLGCFYYEIDL